MLIRKFSICSVEVNCEVFRADCSAIYCSSSWCTYNLAMYRKLRVSLNDILRKLLSVQRYTGAGTLLVNTRQVNVKVLIRKQFYSLKLKIEGSQRE